MPTESVTSIVITAEDDYTSVLKKMSQVTKTFSKDAELLQRAMNELAGEKSLLKAETDKARKAMKEAQTQFTKTGDAAEQVRIETPTRWSTAESMKKRPPEREGGGV